MVIGGIDCWYFSDYNVYNFLYMLPIVDASVTSVFWSRDTADDDWQAEC